MVDLDFARLERTEVNLSGNVDHSLLGLSDLLSLVIPALRIDRTSADEGTGYGITQ